MALQHGDSANPAINCGEMWLQPLPRSCIPASAERVFMTHIKGTFTRIDTGDPFSVIIDACRQPLKSK